MLDPDLAGSKVLGSGLVPDPAGSNLSGSGVDPDQAGSKNSGSGAPLVCTLKIVFCPVVSVYEALKLLQKIISHCSLLTIYSTKLS